MVEMMRQFQDPNGSTLARIKLDETHALDSKSLTSSSLAPFSFMASLTLFMYVLRCDR